MTSLESPPLSAKDYFYSEDNFDGYNSAPLLIIGEEAKPELREQQDRLGNNIVELVYSELSSYANPIVVKFVAKSIISRMHQRESLNGNSYRFRDNILPVTGLTPEYDPEYVLDACEKSKYGKGSMIQKEIARVAFGSKAAEYGNLTIVGDKRKQLETPMWDEVSELVGHDATPKPDQMYGLQVLGFDRVITESSHIGAMRIGMKRLIGQTEFGAKVKARTTAIINMSTSTGIDRDLLKLFKETVIRTGEVSSVAELPEFKNAVSWLVGSELPPGLVLARNETIYGFEPDNVIS
jgi:hypothetical protein